DPLPAAVSRLRRAGAIGGRLRAVPDPALPLAARRPQPPGAGADRGGCGAERRTQPAAVAALGAAWRRSRRGDRQPGARALGGAAYGMCAALAVPVGGAGSDRGPCPGCCRAPGLGTLALRRHTAIVVASRRRNDDAGGGGLSGAGLEA